MAAAAVPAQRGDNARAVRLPPRCRAVALSGQLVVAAGFAAALVFADSLAFWLFVLTRSLSTDRTLLRAWWPRRVARTLRAWWWRYLLWFASWPHAVDRVTRVRSLPPYASNWLEVWRGDGAVLRRVLRYDRQQREPVVIVPALVTEPWILDLLPGRSVAGAMAGAGHDVHLLDFTDPAVDRRRRDLSAYAVALRDALLAVAAHSPTGRVHVVGYCSGATLALALVSAWGAGPVASLSLIAPPVDTWVPGGMNGLLRSRILMPPVALDGRGTVPPFLVREMFHALRPEALRSAWARLRRRRDREFQAVATALTRWAWEQRAVSGKLWFDTVDLARSNGLVRGELHVDGRPCRLERVDVPILLAVTDRDHIVPVASSLALTHHVSGDVRVVRCSGGHVSMLMGSQAQLRLYPALTAWLDEQVSVVRA